MGMPYPGGIHLDRIAEEGGDSAFAFPRPRVDGAEYDFSFSGLKTAVINQIHNASQKAWNCRWPIWRPPSEKLLWTVWCRIFKSG